MDESANTVIVEKDGSQGRCTYFVPRKRRVCKMLVKPGNLFCGEHAIHDEKNSDRIYCPNDPKHTICRSELEEHLLRCNSRITNEEWISVASNAVKGETKSYDKIDRRPTTDELLACKPLLEKCYASIEGVPEERVLNFDKVDDELAIRSDLGKEARKHLMQIGSIISHMNSANLLKNDLKNCVIELGAGKAQLSYWLAKATPLSCFLLTDRSGVRNRWDPKAIKEDPALKMERIRCSIEHLNMTSVPMIQGCSSAVGVCKHFCGSATDSGIRCLLNAIRDGLNLTGFVLVPCCHHKSRYAEYCGREFLAEWDLDSESMFSAVRHMSTWAVCGIPQSEATVDVAENEPMRVPWSSDEKRLLGKKAKLVLEMGRMRFLEKHDFKLDICYYIPSDVSPENILLIGNKL